MNITDVGHLTSDADVGEDKLDISAKREHKTAWQIADFYTQAFLMDEKQLNILAPSKIVKATGHIKEQIILIKLLETRGYTYIATDGVYFDTSKFKQYGRLSRQSINEKKVGTRVEAGQKRNPVDFALWKFSPKGKKRDMEWASPWGVGFPGWHVECSAMSKKYLGQPFDIHGGGIDHLPVHHENEIAQSVAAYGLPLANIWLHGEFLVLGKQGKDVRMGKSLNNFLTVKDVVRLNIDPLAYRYLCLTTHYRSKLFFSEISLEGASKALIHLREAVQRLPKPAKTGVLSVEKKFAEAIYDDLDTPKALAIVWDLVRSKHEPSKIKRSLLKFDKVFGLELNKKNKSVSISKNVSQLIEKREKARKEKNWSLADSIRDEIENAGFILEDSSSGPQIKKK